MSLSVVGISVAVIALMATAVAAYSHRKRQSARKETLTSDSEPLSETYLLGMRYRAWGGARRELVHVEGRCDVVTDFSASELLERPVCLIDLVHPDDKQHVEREISRALETSSAYELNYRIRTKSGKWRWVSDRGGPSMASDSGTVGVNGVLLNISDRVAAEHARVRAEQKYQLLAKHATDLVCIHDADARFKFVTPSASLMLGYSPSDMVGRSIYPLVHADDRDQLRAKIQKDVKEDCESTTARYRLRAKSGRYVYVETVFTPTRDRDGYYTRFISVSRDVSEAARLRRQLDALRDKSERLRLDEAAVANVSHELRTPLTGIMGLADVLSEELADEQRKLAKMIQSSGERLLSTLSSIMDFSTLDTPSTRRMRAQIDVVPIAVAEVNRYRETAKERGVTLQLVTEREEIIAYADREAVSRMLDQLLSNAMKFTEPEGCITVGVLQEEEHTIVRVADTGIGISDAFLPHIYEPFRQESTGFSRTHEGVGIGLSIVRKLVEANDGTVMVNSMKGRGSTFSIRLPAVRVQGDPDVRTTPARHEPHHAPKKQIHGKVLAVDDNMPMRLILRRHLEKQFEVEEAADPNEALEQAGARDYDLILLDMNLGTEMNGMDVLAELRGMSQHKDTFVIAITAYALPEERSRFLKAGFDGFIAKPFTREKLLKEISRVTMFPIKLGEKGTTGDSASSQIAA